MTPSKPPAATVTADEINRVARLLIAEWGRVEREPVNISRIATFADMARVAIADRQAALDAAEAEAAGLREQLAIAESDDARHLRWANERDERITALEAELAAAKGETKRCAALGHAALVVTEQKAKADLARVTAELDESNQLLDSAMEQVATLNYEMVGIEKALIAGAMDEEQIERIVGLLRGQGTATLDAALNERDLALSQVRQLECRISKLEDERDRAHDLLRRIRGLLDEVRDLPPIGDLVRPR